MSNRAAQPLPDTLRVGPYDVSLERSSEPLIDGNLGDFDLARLAIRVAEGLPAQQEHLILWHEAFHGVFYNAGVREHDEGLIDIISAGIVQILRDNPWMVAPVQSVKKGS
jgi:hypothetical protein